ncbi:DNA-directed RNA polymerase subunit alpha C-terminal domain-containing protein [Actinomadura syzygii]|uniref:RNA polymerase alpha subunit C-terminal domain-containing protein n=1 Tax=Actinomadura syzygii TaxID=1427538 RepID=A0A5D0TTB3_9ACTN|nr:DNA-directed RNA polymerase subunit alpha C-terminal domain-containing protein [Actinomadura syzygii]TYC08944.1 hypothetical protein FXF65_36080 [Actinomadura syzygii]
MDEESQPAEKAIEYEIALPADAYWTRDGRIPLGPDLTEALNRAVKYLEQGEFGSLSFVAAFDGHWPRDERTIVYRVDDGVVLTLDGRDLQDQVRTALDAGEVDGWSHLPTPETPIPLTEVQARLGVRVYNLLARQGFRTLDEVLAVPEETLRQERGVGRHCLEKIRQLRDPEGPLIRVAHTRPVRQQDEHADLVRRRMSPASLQRYGVLVEPLGQCDLAVSALSVIADSLNSEPLPPADPAVVRLLRDAAEPGLLDAYLRTHEAVPETGSPVSGERAR